MVNRRDDTNGGDGEGNGRTFGVRVPSWVASAGQRVIDKGGPWAVLAFLLVYLTFVAKNAMFATMSANIASNGKAIAANGEAVANVAHLIGEASTAMHAVVLEQQKTQERQTILLLEVCVQQAEALKIAGGTQRCFDAARGRESARSQP